MNTEKTLVELHNHIQELPDEAIMLMDIGKCSEILRNIIHRFIAVNIKMHGNIRLEVKDEQD